MKRILGIITGSIAVISMSLTATAEEPIALTTDMIKDTLLRVKIADGEEVLDGERAGKNFKDTGRPRIGKSDTGLSRVLLRIDVSNLRLLDLKNIDKARLVLNYSYPGGNPTLGLYRVTDQDADWNLEQATWKQKNSDEEWTGGTGGGEPGAGTYAEDPIDTCKADNGGKVEFEIPSSLVRTWIEGDNADQKNPSLMLRFEDKGSVKLQTQGYPPGSSTHLYVDADWKADKAFYRKASGKLSLLGAPAVDKQLIDQTLQSALQEFNPNLSKVPADDISTRWCRWYPGQYNAFNIVRQGGYDLAITSRQDWKERVSEEQKKGLTYVPVAKQLVYRDGDVAGGVEYAVVFRNDAWIPQVHAFVKALRSSVAQKRLAQDNTYLFAPLDKELPSFEPPSYWREKPWKTEKEPMMVHGVDFHQGGYYTTVLAELTKMKMLGYNSVMYGGHPEKVMEWADENGMLLSGMAHVTKEDRKGGRSRHAAAAKKMAKHPSCWGAFLANEDTATHWMVKMYRGELGKNPPARVKAFARVKYGGFEEWAKQKHKNLEKLNDRWNTDYNSWADIFLPDPRLEEIVDIYDRILDPEDVGYQWRTRLGARGIRYTMAKYPDLLDLHRQCRRVWASWYDERIVEMREYLGDDFRYTVKAKPQPYTHRASKQFNGACHDHGPPKSGAVDLQIFVDTVQIAKGWPVWNAEDHIYTPPSTPRLVRFDIFSKYLMGQFQDTSYYWGSTSGRAISRKRGTEHYQAEKETRDKIRRYEPILRAFLEARAKADLAVLVTEGNRAWDEYDPRPEESYLGGAIKAYAYMGALGRQWKYVLDRDISAESVQDVLVIDAPWLTDQTIERLSKLPSDRRLIAVGEVPNTNEYGEPLPEDALNKVKKRATVIQDWPELSDVVKPADGLMEPYTAIGQGKYWTWNRFRGRSPWAYHLPTARLELRRVKHDGKLYLAVLNHADKAIRAPIPWAEGHEVRDLMSDTPNESIQNTDSHKFGKEDVALFELR